MRIKGLAPFSANFEPQIATPLDAREIVQYQSDLISTTVWQANDGIVYAYKGMKVVVTDDPTPANNGLYYLKDEDYTILSNWEKVGTGIAAGFKRVEVDSIPMVQIPIPFNIPSVAGGKYFPKIGDYYGLFLFEVYDNTGALVGTDLNFADQATFYAWVDANLLNGQDYVLRCYYYEDDARMGQSRVKGRNMAYSVLKTRNHYFSSSIRTFGDAYPDVPWLGKAAFVRTVIQDFFGYDCTGAEATYAAVLWFPRNQKRLYNQHRDDLSPPDAIEYFTESYGRTIVDDTGAIVGDISTVVPALFEIQASRFYAFSANAPTTVSWLPNNTRRYDMIGSYHSIIKIYHIRDSAGNNGLLVKPCGEDEFYLDGMVQTPVNCIVSFEGKKQTTYMTITPTATSQIHGDVLYKISKYQFVNWMAPITYIRNPTKGEMNTARFMFNYGGGYFGKRSNPIKLIPWKPGINLQLRAVQ